MHSEPTNGIILSTVFAHMACTMSSITWAVSTCSLAPDDYIWGCQMWAIWETTILKNAIFAMFRTLKSGDKSAYASNSMAETLAHTSNNVPCQWLTLAISLHLFIHNYQTHALFGDFFIGAKCWNFGFSWAVPVMLETPPGMFRHSKRINVLGKVFLRNVKNFRIFLQNFWRPSNLDGEAKYTWLS